GWMPADGGDLVSFLFPTYRFAAAGLSQGAWPLWNPYLYGGAPHAGDIQAGFLYPPNLVLFLANPQFPYRALQALSMAHVWFAGAGMYLLLARGFSLRRVAAVAGALAFMFSDAFLTHFGNLNLNAALSWLPWIFWAYPLPRSLNPLRLALTAFLLALSITAGHIQATLFIVLALAFYTLFALWLRRDEPGPWRGAALALLGLGGVVLAAALLAAPILLPALQLAEASSRAAWDYHATAGYSLAPAQLVGWLVPGFFGRGPQYYWGAWPRVEVGYIGVLTLVLAALGIALRYRKDGKVIWPWVALAGASFVLALGVYAIPHGWLTLLPGFSQLRAPARFVYLTDFGLAALAAFGLDALLRLRSARDDTALAAATRGLGWAAAIALGVVTPLAYLALLLVQDRDPAIVNRVSITLIAVVDFALLLGASFLWLLAHRKGLGRPVTLAWLAAGLIFFDLASLGAYQDLGGTDPSAGYRHDQIAAFLTSQPGPFRIDTRTQIESLWQPDTALLYELEDVGGVANPLVLADTGRYWEALGSRSTLLYDLLNVRYVLGKKDIVLDWNVFTLAFDGDPQLNVYENKNFLPRAFIVPAAQHQPTQDRVLEALKAPGFDPRQTAIILGAESQSVPAGGRGDVTNIKTGRNSLSFRTTTDAPALVFVSQVWYPGWQVWIDGKSAGEPWRADYLFQAVSVPQGEHTVELRFTPPLWRIGWVLAAGVLLLVLLGILLMRRYRRVYGN
ncbi:MAG: YfhO family protein, partial [Nitrososphaerales archaeon]